MSLLAVTGKQWPKLYEIKVSPIKKPIEEGIIEQLCLYEPLNGGFVLADPAQREWGEAEHKMMALRGPKRMFETTHRLKKLYLILGLG